MINQKIWMVFLICILAILVQFHCQYDNISEKISKAEKLFKANLKQTRREHGEALQHILKSMNYEKQFKLTNQVFQKLFDVLTTAKAILEGSDYIPSLDFPSNETVIEALGQVLDNAAFFAEFQLKLPDITDRILKSKNDWLIMGKWAISFANSTGIYDDKTIHLINLVCQELNLVEKSENFINPYRKSFKEKTPEPKVMSTPKVKKVFKKGPRMSRTSHSEL